ncbi:MAG: hypothetical protein WC655_07495 [Candidatus Hydrogenedentales bacterium]|jgi:hypothetical protein
MTNANGRGTTRDAGKRRESETIRTLIGSLSDAESVLAGLQSCPRELEGK